MFTVPVTGVPSVIRLGQFLKLADLVEDGVMARVFIQGGGVLVNGVAETRRGRQLSHGDMIEADSPTGRVGAHIHAID